MKKRIFILCGVMMFVFALFGKDVNAKESSHTADAICYSSSDQSEYDGSMLMVRGIIYSQME